MQSKSQTGNVVMMREATKLTNLELIARLYDSAETLREQGHRSALADWCEEAATRLRSMYPAYIDDNRRCA
jgi:hypothetical protein